MRRNSERTADHADSRIQPPTPRTDRISADYDREKQAYEQYLSVRRAETVIGGVDRKNSTPLTRPLDQFSDIRVIIVT